MLEDSQIQILREGSDNNVFLTKDKQGKKSAVIRINKRGVKEDVIFEIAWLKELKNKKGSSTKNDSYQKGQDFFIDKKGQVYVVFEYLNGTHLEIKANLKPNLDFNRKSSRSVSSPA